MELDLRVDGMPSGPAFERHFTVPEIAKIWGLHPDTVRRMFENEHDVITIHHPERLHKRQHTTLRIPESAVARVHRKWTCKTKSVM